MLSSQSVYVLGPLQLMMVVNHSSSSLRRFTDQPVGFFTTAEAFVFVSAFLAGILFRKRIEKNGFNAARSSWGSDSRWTKNNV